MFNQLIFALKILCFLSKGGDYPLGDAGGWEQRPQLRLRDQEEGVRQVQVCQDLLLHARSGKIMIHGRRLLQSESLRKDYNTKIADWNNTLQSGIGFLVKK